MKKIIQSWLLVGTLDILAAFLQFYIKTGKGPAPVLKYIASAVLGSKAFEGGTIVLLTGLLLHFTVALLFSIFFFIIFPFLYNMVKNRIAIGILYGAFIWTIMNIIVVPLTSAPALKTNATSVMIAMVILIVCIGIPLSLLAPKSKS